MNFLEWYNPLSWLGDVKNEIVGSIVKALRTLFYQLSVVIYKIVIYLYNTFETLCNARLLNDDIIQQLASRIGLILGIIMLFMVTISFIQMLLEPDNVNDKEKGAVNVIKKVLIVIVMFAVSNFAFSALYQFQKTIIKSNVISKLILPNSVDTDKFGGVLAAELFVAFYDVDLILKDTIDTSDNSVDLEGAEFCQQLVYSLKTNIANDYNFELGYYCLNEHTTVDIPNADKKQQIHIIDFNLLLCPIVGCVCIWMLFSYCIMVGTRIIIIAFLEIISPMAFISYLSPKKDTMFSKWLKLYTATYLDAFIRIAIINFVVFLIATIFTYGETNTFWNSVDNPDGFTKKFIMVLIILSLLTFAKKAPELLKDLFPSSASKLGLGGFHMKDALGLQKGLATVAGIGTGAAVGLIGGRSLGSMLGGAFRGGRAGFGAKNVLSSFGAARKAQADNIAQLRNLKNDGGSRWGRFGASARNAFGLETEADIYDNEIKKIDKDIQDEKEHTAADRRNMKVYSLVNDKMKKMEEHALKKLNKGDFEEGSTRDIMQKNLLTAQAKVERLKASNANEDDIVNATREYNRIEKRLTQAYIAQANSGLFDDDQIKSLNKDILTTVQNNSTLFEGMDTTLTSGNALADFDKAINNRSNEINRTISESDLKIQSMEDQKLNIQSSKPYRAAQANKNHIKKG